MIKLIKILKESLNLKAGNIYPDVDLTLSPINMGGKTYTINNINGEEIGAVVVKDIDGVKNVIYSIFISPEYRNKHYALPVYVNLAKMLGSICSGEYREDGTSTSFVSEDADKIWKRLKEIYPIEKIKIQGNKFRYCLNSKKL
jgi:hypothetical protein